MRPEQGKRLVGPADLLTALRFPLAALFPFVHQPGWELGIVATAAVTDLADGWLARRYGGSRTGALLDPVADKAFMVSAFVTVARRGLLTPLEIALVLLRDIVAVLAYLGTVVLRHPHALPARAGGKAVTVGQVLTLVAFILESPLVRPLAYATGAVALYAIWDYSRAARSPVPADLRKVS